MERLDLLVRQVRDQTGNQQYSATQGIRQREFVRYANDAQMRIYNKIMMERSTLYTKLGYLDVDANDAIYDLPVDIFLKHNVLKVDYSQNGDARNYSPLVMRSPRQEVSTQGHPDSYFLRDGEIVLSPIPSQSAVNGLRLNYQYTLPTLDIRRAKVSSVADSLIESAEWSLQTSGFGASTVSGIAYGAGLFVIVGQAGKLATSPDGVTWTMRTSSFGVTAINSVIYAGGRFLACGASGTIATSLDGITWAQQVSNAAQSLTTADYLGNLYVCYGALGTLTTSPDGVTWTLQTTNLGAVSISTMSYYEGIYMIAGGGGLIDTSHDGVTWTARTSGLGAIALYCSTYADDLGLFVVAGASGGLATSPDAVTWTVQTTGFGANTIWTVIYEEGVLLIGGAASQIFSSTDAITWTSRTSAFRVSADINRLYYANGFFWALGNTGQASVSTDGLTWSWINPRFNTAAHNRAAFSDGSVVMLGAIRLSTYQFGGTYSITLDTATVSTETAEELENSWVDYVCIVDADGEILVNEIGVTSYNSITRVLTVESDASLINIVGYIVFGKNASTHSQLPEVSERYLTEYMAMRIQMRDSNSEAVNQSSVLNELETEIIDSIANLEEDLLSVAILDSSMLNYDEGL